MRIGVVARGTHSLRPNVDVIGSREIFFRKWDQYKINDLGFVCEGLVIKMDQ